VALGTALLEAPLAGRPADDRLFVTAAFLWLLPSPRHSLSLSSSTVKLMAHNGDLDILFGELKGATISIRALSWRWAPRPVNIGRWSSLSCT
jgi:hypothetical protein